MIGPSPGQQLYEQHAAPAAEEFGCTAPPWEELPEQSRRAWEENALDFLAKQKLDRQETT